MAERLTEDQKRENAESFQRFAGAFQTFKEEEEDASAHQYEFDDSSGAAVATCRCGEWKLIRLNPKQSEDEGEPSMDIVWMSHVQEYVQDLKRARAQKEIDSVNTRDAHAIRPEGTDEGAIK